MAGATYKASMKVLEPVEGGYCKGGMACGSKASGETYRGIDRGQWPKWIGWPVIDAYKKSRGPIPHNSYIKDPNLDLAVEAFYTNNFWNPLGFNNFKNQTLAALVYVFAVQRMYDAVKVFNGVATKLGVPKTSQSNLRITPAAAQAIEKNVAAGYILVRSAIITYYLGRYVKATAENYIRNRVTIFPEKLVTATPVPVKPVQPTPTQPAANDQLKDVGILLSLWKLFF